MGDEGGEDPVILQALADTLMDAYHTGTITKCKAHFMRIKQCSLY